MRSLSSRPAATPTSKQGPSSQGPLTVPPGPPTLLLPQASCTSLLVLTLEAASFN